MCASLTGDLLLSLVGREVVCMCTCTPLTGDLLSSLVGRVVVYVCFPDRRLVIESCR